MLDRLNMSRLLDSNHIDFYITKCRNLSFNIEEQDGSTKSVGSIRMNEITGHR